MASSQDEAVASTGKPNIVADTVAPPPIIASVQTTNNPDSSSAGSTNSNADPYPTMHPVVKTTTGRSARSIPFASLDPEGTAELTRRLTAHSILSERDLEHGVNPFSDDGNFDLEKFLKHLIHQHDERGIERREMGLVWKNLTVTGLGSGIGLSSDFGSMLLAPFKVFSNLSSLFHTPVKTILDNFEGCVKPGEMLLVLGRPGAGCTSFLKTIASYRDGFKDIQGTVLYQGMDHTIIDKTLRGDVVYCPEDDVHFPTLTVWETLSFAAASRAPQARRRLPLRPADGDRETRDGYVNLVVEVLATILGLKHTYNTKIGNELIRGVSGGERKRVSVAETLATRARVALFDNSSRGLDSSTALEFVRSLRIGTDLANVTTVASIYQAGEALTQLFDKVLVINEGKQVYFGPTSAAVEYFNEMGFVPLDRQTTADYLVACTDLNGRNVRPGFEDRVPRTAEEMAKAWQSSKEGQANKRQVDEYLEHLRTTTTADTTKHYKQVAQQDKAHHTRANSAYVISIPMQITLAVKRRAQIVWGDIATQLVITLAAIFQAIISGSVYFQMHKDTSGFFSRGGILFFTLLYNSFTAMTEITASYSQRPIVIRQRRFAMVHPFSDAIGRTLLDIPIRTFTITFFTIIIYFMTGLSLSAEQFFVFYGFTLLTTFVMVAFFRMLAAITKNSSIATMMGGLAVIDMALYAGYVIPRPSMVVWWRWLSYCNPMAFAFEVLLSNEFRRLDVPCRQFVPFGPAYANVDRVNQVCPIAGAVPGQTLVSGSKYLDLLYNYNYKNTPRNAGILIGFWIFFLAVFFVASEFQKDPTASGGVMIFKRDKVPAALLQTTKASGDIESPGKEGDATIDAVAQQEVHDKAAKESTSKIASSDSVFSWRNVNYDVLIKGNPRRLLNNVSGYVAPGKMTALMGESGAGKTTLLNVLAQRADTGVVEGIFNVNGQDLPKSFQASTGYCQQQDVHLQTQTVREALQFSALLRQPREVPDQEKLDYVENVIKLLEMDSWADAIVGEIGQGLNVEQRKRLTIGVELAAKPKLLLFLDEPTSGLDAMAAWSIVRFLRKLADAGQAILCTIHQPSGELFNQFDRLLLLQKGGKTVYFGDIGSNSSKLIEYFSERSGQTCGDDDNPAEYILDVIGAGATATTNKDWHQLFMDSNLYSDLQADLDRVESSRDLKVSPEDEAMGRREYAVPLSAQFKLVVKRAFTHYYRSTVYLTSKIMLNVIGGLFIGSSFWGQGKAENLASVQNKIFAVFMALMLSTSLSQQLQPQFIHFRSLYEVRERPSKMYSWPVAVLTAVVVEIPWNLLGGTLFWIPWYWMIQFPSNSRVVATVWGFYMLFQIYFQTFAAAIASISPNPMIASILFSTFFSFVIVFCGVVQPPRQLPHFWKSWMFPLSPFTYLIESILGVVVDKQPVRCNPREFNYIQPPAGKDCATYLANFTTSLDGPDLGTGYYQNAPNGMCAYCQYRKGNDFLTTNELSANHIYRNFGIICAYIVFNLLLCFALFYFFRIYKSSSSNATKKTKNVSQPDTKSSTPVHSTTNESVTEKVNHSPNVETVTENAKDTTTTENVTEKVNAIPAAKSPATETVTENAHESTAPAAVETVAEKVNETPATETVAEKVNETPVAESVTAKANEPSAEATTNVPITNDKTAEAIAASNPVADGPVVTPQDSTA